MKNTNIVLAALMLLVSTSTFASTNEDARKSLVVNVHTLPVSAPEVDVTTPPVVVSTVSERTPEQKASAVELDLMTVAVSKN